MGYPISGDHLRHNLISKKRKICGSRSVINSSSIFLLDLLDIYVYWDVLRWDFQQIYLSVESAVRKQPDVLM